MKPKSEAGPVLTQFPDGVNEAFFQVNSMSRCEFQYPTALKLGRVSACVSVVSSSSGLVDLLQQSEVFCCRVSGGRSEETRSERDNWRSCKESVVKVLDGCFV